MNKTLLSKTVYPSPFLEPNCNIVPVISDITSFPATPASPTIPAPLAPPAPGLATPCMTSNAFSASSSRKTRSKRPTVYVAKRRRVQKFTLTYRWKKAVFRHMATTEEKADPTDDVQILFPLEYLYKYFSPDILADIVEQINAYAISKTGRTIGFTEDELRDFLAIHIIMGVVTMPSYTDYWSLRYRYKLVADLMPLKRYQQIRRYLHFVDNNIQDSDSFFFLFSAITFVLVRNYFIFLDVNVNCVCGGMTTRL